MASVKVAVLLLVVFCISSQKAEDFSVGSSINGELVYTENVKLSSIPLKTRTKNVFYSDNSTRIIKGIWAIDLDQSKAKGTITAGGVGSTFVNLRLKSARGDGLNYQVQVFA